MPYGLKDVRETDANGRKKERIITKDGEKIAGEYYYYRKQGDHGANQISFVRYGERKNREYVIKDGVSYVYDGCGNISEVKENGKLSSRYSYDKLNRLIREDNAKLQKTTLFTYDNNGNILSKREAPFCLKETEKITSLRRRGSIPTTLNNYLRCKIQGDISRNYTPDVAESDKNRIFDKSRQSQSIDGVCFFRYAINVRFFV